jgi:hypothetical protein
MWNLKKKKKPRNQISYFSFLRVVDLLHNSKKRGAKQKWQINNMKKSILLLNLVFLADLMKDKSIIPPLQSTIISF